MSSFKVILLIAAIAMVLSVVAAQFGGRPNGFGGGFGGRPGYAGGFGGRPGFGGGFGSRPGYGGGFGGRPGYGGGFGQRGFGPGFG